MRPWASCDIPGLGTLLHAAIPGVCRGQRARLERGGQVWPGRRPPGDVTPGSDSTEAGSTSPVAQVSTVSTGRQGARCLAQNGLGLGTLPSGRLAQSPWSWGPWALLAAPLGRCAVSTYDGVLGGPFGGDENPGVTFLLQIPGPSCGPLHRDPCGEFLWLRDSVHLASGLWSWAGPSPPWSGPGLGAAAVSKRCLYLVRPVAPGEQRLGLRTSFWPQMVPGMWPWGKSLPVSLLLWPLTPTAWSHLGGGLKRPSTPGSRGPATSLCLWGAASCSSG